LPRPGAPAGEFAIATSAEKTGKAESAGHRRARLPAGPIGRLLASVGNLSHLLDSIHSRYAQAHGLGTRGIWTLSAISEGRTSPGDIARLMLIPPSVVSGDLNQLLEAGLIERRKHTGDKRRLIYTLTEEGQALLSGAHAVYVEVMGDLLDAYPRAELDQMLRMLFEISRHLRDRTGGEYIALR
jgi:DNA-binding MarR family transcriptional regulator